MIRRWDGFLSILAALLTGAIVGLPLWAAFKSVQAQAVPVWFWAPMLVLGVIGLLMIGAFLRKAMRGVHPARERRR